jgi:hypothetical protein
MASGGKPGSMFWWEYDVSNDGTATLVGGWCYDAGMNAPGEKWSFTLTGRPEDKASDAAHMLTPVSREFLRQCADAARAEMQLSERDRFALVLTIPDEAVSAPARPNETSVE